MSWHVKRTRVADTSTEHELGGPDQTGTVRYSKTFRSQPAAQREAAGDYARHGPTDWTAEVAAGPPPGPPKCYCGHAKRNHINGRGLCLVRSCRLCLIYAAPGQVPS